MLVRVLLLFFLTTGAAEARSRRSRKARARPPPVAKAPPTVLVPVSLDGAIQLYQNAQFASSLGVLDTVVRGGPDVSTLKQAKLYMGMNFLALGNDGRAKAAFQDLLELDPDFELPTFSSPSVRQFYARVRSEYKIIPVIGHTPPQVIDAVNGAAFEVTLKKMRPGYEAKMFYRAQGELTYSRIDLSRVQTETYVARLPAALLVREQGYSLEYYLAVSEGPTHVLESLRSAVSPFVVPVSVPLQLQVGTPVYKKWWLWTIVGGAVLAAGAAVTAVILTSQTPPTGQANIGLKF